MSEKSYNSSNIYIYIELCNIVKQLLVDFILWILVWIYENITIEFCTFQQYFVLCLFVYGWNIISSLPTEWQYINFNWLKITWKNKSTNILVSHTHTTSENS